MTTNKRRILKIEEPLKCLILERVNRFVVKVLLDDKPTRAYVNNTGRLHDYLNEGRTGFCIRPRRPGKTDCRLFGVSEDGLAAIVDTQLQMEAFEKALEMGLFPWMKGYRLLKRNERLGGSLIDYLLDCRGETVYLEVKSAVMKEGEVAMYPDCPSARGRKHIRELTEHVKGGGHGSVLFIAALPGVKAFRPNQSADPELSRMLTEALKVGVELRSIGLYFDPEDSFVYLFDPDLEVYMS